MSQRRQWPPSGRVLLGAFVASGLLHLGLLALGGSWLLSFLLSSPAEAAPAVQMLRVSASDWAKNREIHGASPQIQGQSPSLATAKPSKSSEAPQKPKPEPKAEPKPKPEPKTAMPKGQIVEVAQSADRRPNPNAKYLASVNSHAEKETVARYRERDRRAKRVTRQLEQPKAQPLQPGGLVADGISLQGEGGTGGQAAPKKSKKRRSKPKGGQKLRFELPDIQRREAVDLKPAAGPGRPMTGLKNQRGSEARRGNADKLNIQLGSGEGQGEAGGDGKRPGIQSLSQVMPTLGMVAKVRGSPSSDYVEGVAEGDGTFLNTKEFKYASFFYRVRDSVGPIWERKVMQAVRRRDPTGEIYGSKNRYTTIAVELDAKGQLTQARVARGSGLRFLDQQALQAFKEASPFPHPPLAMADADGKLRFRFQFVLIMSQGPRWLFGGEKLKIGRLAHQLLDFAGLAEVDFEHPAVVVHVLVQGLGRLDDGVVLLEHLAGERRVEVGNGFDRLHHAKRLASRDRLARIGQLAIHDVAEGVLGMPGDPQNGRVALDAAPFVLFGVFQVFGKMLIHGDVLYGRL